MTVCPTFRPGSPHFQKYLLILFYCSEKAVTPIAVSCYSLLYILLSSEATLTPIPDIKLEIFYLYSITYMTIANYCHYYYDDDHESDWCDTPLKYPPAVYSSVCFACAITIIHNIIKTIVSTIILHRLLYFDACRCLDQSVSTTTCRMFFPSIPLQASSSSSLASLC